MTTPNSLWEPKCHHNEPNSNNELNHPKLLKISFWVCLSVFNAFHSLPKGSYKTGRTRGQLCVSLKTVSDLEGAPFADLPVPCPLGVHTWVVHRGRNNPNNFLWWNKGDKPLGQLSPSSNGKRMSLLIIPPESPSTTGTLQTRQLVPVKNNAGENKIIHNKERWQSLIKLLSTSNSVSVFRTLGVQHEQ